MEFLIVTPVHTFPSTPTPRQVGGKVLADGMEALVGAFVVGSGEEATLVFMRVRPWGGRVLPLLV